MLWFSVGYADSCYYGFPLLSSIFSLVQSMMPKYKINAIMKLLIQRGHTCKIEVSYTMQFGYVAIWGIWVSHNNALSVVPSLIWWHPLWTASPSPGRPSPYDLIIGSQMQSRNKTFVMVHICLYKRENAFDDWGCCDEIFAPSRIQGGPLDKWIDD